MPEFAYSTVVKPKIGFVPQPPAARPKRAMILTLPPQRAERERVNRTVIGTALASLAILLLLVALLWPQQPSDTAPMASGAGTDDASIKVNNANESMTGQFAEVAHYDNDNARLMAVSPKLTEEQRQRLLTILEYN